MSTLQKLASAGFLPARIVLDAFNPDQPRDEKGQWTSGEGGGGHVATTREAFSKASKWHAEQAVAARNAGSHAIAAQHEHASQLHEKAASAYKGASLRKLEYTGAVARESSYTLGKEDLRATQRELPAVAAETAKQVPHAFIPAGNQKTPTERLAVDPNRVTQREMPTVGAEVGAVQGLSSTLQRIDEQRGGRAFDLPTPAESAERYRLQQVARVKKEVRPPKRASTSTNADPRLSSVPNPFPTKGNLPRFRDTRADGKTNPFPNSATVAQKIMLRMQASQLHARMAAAYEKKRPK